MKELESGKENYIFPSLWFVCSLNIDTDKVSGRTEGDPGRANAPYTLTVTLPLHTMLPQSDLDFSLFFLHNIQ